MEELKQCRICRKGFTTTTDAGVRWSQWENPVLCAPHRGIPLTNGAKLEDAVEALLNYEQTHTASDPYTLAQLFSAAVTCLTPDPHPRFELCMNNWEKILGAWVLRFLEANVSLLEELQTKTKSEDVPHKPEPDKQPPPPSPARTQELAEEQVREALAARGRSPAEVEQLLKMLRPK